MACLTNPPTCQAASPPKSMPTANYDAEVFSASTAIGAAVRVKRGSMSSDKNRERGANI